MSDVNNLLVILLVALGYLLRRLGVVEKDAADSIVKIVFYVFLPATIFYSLSHLEFRPDLLLMPLAGFSVALSCYLFAYFTKKSFGMDKPMQGSFIITSGAMNQAFFIYPFALIYLGTEGLGYAIFYDLGQAALALTLAYYIATKYGDSPNKNRSVLGNMVRFPTLWALFLALSLSFSGAYHHIEEVMPFLEMLHNCTTPLIMLSLGIFLEPRIAKVKPTLRVVFTRFVFSVGVAAIFVYLFDLTGIQRTIVLAASAAPPAMLTLVYAVEEKLDVEFTAALLSVTMPIGLIYIPILFNLF